MLRRLCRRYFFDSSWRTRDEGHSVKTPQSGIQVNNIGPAKWNLVLNNAKNVQDDDGVVDVDIAIVV